jgi:hypothetical protein
VQWNLLKLGMETGNRARTGNFLSKCIVRHAEDDPLGHGRLEALRRRGPNPPSRVGQNSVRRPPQSVEICLATARVTTGLREQRRRENYTCTPCFVSKRLS